MEVEKFAHITSWGVFRRTHANVNTEPLYIFLASYMSGDKNQASKFNSPTPNHKENLFRRRKYGLLTWKIAMNF